MDPILKVNLSIQFDWEKLIAWFDGVVKNFFTNIHIYEKRSYSWAADTYTINDKLSINITNQQFVTDTNLSTIYIYGQEILDLCEFANQIKNRTKDLTQGPIFFYIMRQRGIVNRHIDRSYEVPVLQYFINQSDVITKCEANDQVYEFPGNMNTGYILNSILPHWVDNPNNAVSYSLNFRYKTSYRVLYNWFQHNSINLS